MKALLSDAFSLEVLCMVVVLCLATALGALWREARKFERGVDLLGSWKRADEARQEDKDNG